MGERLDRLRNSRPTKKGAIIYGGGLALAGFGGYYWYSKGAHINYDLDLRNSVIGTSLVTGGIFLMWNRFASLRPKRREEGDKRISTLQGTAIGIGASAAFLTIALASGAVGDSEKASKLPGPSSSTVDLGTTAPSVSGPIELGGGTLCEIVPYFKDSKDIVGNQAEIDARDWSAVTLKKYLWTLGFYSGEFSPDVDESLSIGVNGFQKEHGIDPALPWNLDTCLASALGDGKPGPDLSTVG